MRRSKLPGAALLLALAACQSSPSAGAPPPASPTPPAPPPTQAPALPVEALRSLVPADVSAGCGTPTIDGVIAPDEWKSAVSVRFGAVLPESAGGGTVPAEIMAMSDDKNLYVAYRYAADTARYSQSHYVELDANHSGQIDGGDDGWGLSWWTPPPDYLPSQGTTLFTDFYRVACTADGHPAVCGPADTDPAFGPPGTSDGGAAIGFADGVTTVESWHPYHDGETRDVQAKPGDTIPMQFFIRLLACSDWPRCFGDTSFPPYGTYRPFRLACGAPPGNGGDDDEDVIEVRIDVKPGDPLPTLQLGAGGLVAVAVHGSAAFDAGQVDAATLWFAGAPAALDPAGKPQVSTADVNGDGVPDLVARFEVAALQLRPGDAEASLAGRTVAGRRFHGTDAVRVIP